MRNEIRRKLSLEHLESRQLMTIGLDSTFGTGGVVVGSDPIDFEVQDRALTSVAQQDKLVLASSIATGRGFELTVLSRYNANGALDASFGNGGVTRLPLDHGDEALQDLVTTPDGGLLALVSCSGRTSVLAKFTSNGVLDSNFGKSGILYFEGGLLSPGSLAFDANGNFFISQVYSGTDLQLAKYSSAGLPDRTFAGVGYLRFPVKNPVPTLHNLLVMEDGSVLLSYSSRTDTPNYQLYVHRVLSDGTLDSQFGTDGRFTWDLSNDARYGEVGKVKLLFDGLGNVLAVGTKRTDDLQDYFVVKFNSEGDLVRSYGNEGTVNIVTGSKWGTIADDAELMEDGSLILTGTIGLLSNPISAKVNANGSSWTLGNPIANIQSQGAIGIATRLGSRVLASYSNRGTGDINIVAFQSDGMLDTTFGTSGTVSVSLGHTWDASWGGDVLELQDGKLLTLKTLELPYGFAHPRDLVLTRRLADGSVDSSYGTNGSLVLSKDLFPSPDSHFLSGGGGNYFFSTSDNALDIYKLTTHGNIDSSFGSQGRLNIPRSRLQALYSVTATTDGFLLTGLGTGADYGNYLILKYDNNGVVVSNFGKAGSISVPHQLQSSSLQCDLSLTSDGGFLARFRYSDSFGTLKIMRFDANGQLDSSFGNNGSILDYWPIRSQIVSVENGDFFLVSSELRRFHANGELDRQFGRLGTVDFDLPGSWKSPQLDAVKVDAQGSLVIAVEFEDSQDRDTLLMRFNQDGKRDSSFGVAGFLRTDLSQYDDILNELSFSSAGKIYFSGSRLTDQFRQAVFGRVGENGRANRPWHHFQSPTDSSGDGLTSPLDALIVINYLNRFASQAVPEEWPELGWLDVSADNFLSPIDALLVINALNSRGEGERSAASSMELDAASLGYWDLSDLQISKRNRIFAQ